jgi:hypothetical protein
MFRGIEGLFKSTFIKNDIMSGCRREWIVKNILQIDDWKQPALIAVNVELRLSNWPNSTNSLNVMFSDFKIVIAQSLFLLFVFPMLK